MLKKRIPIISLILILISLFFTPHAFAENNKHNLDLSAYKGKVVVVDFWASWCLPCRKSFPWLNKMQATLKPKGFVIIGVNVDENSQDAKNFLKKYPANFPVIFDPNGYYAERYKIIGMPSTLIFDRQGKLIEQHVGFKESHIKDYENTINKILTNKI